MQQFNLYTDFLIIWKIVWFQNIQIYDQITMNAMNLKLKVSFSVWIIQSRFHLVICLQKISALRLNAFNNNMHFIIVALCFAYYVMYHTRYIKPIACLWRKIFMQNFRSLCVNKSFTKYIFKRANYLFRLKNNNVWEFS